MPNWLRIALCDLKRMMKDRLAIFWMVIMPLGFVYLFGGMMGDPSDQTTWLPVINLDQHELSTKFIDQLKADKVSVDVRSATDEQYVQYWARTIILPATFSASILEGEHVDVIFAKGKGNQEHTLNAQVRLANAIVKFTGALAAVDVVNNRWTQKTQEKLDAELNKTPQFIVEKKMINNLKPPPFGQALLLPGYIVMFVLMNTIMFGGISLLQEKNQRSDVRLSSTPTSNGEIFLGKMAGRSLIPILQATSLIILGNFIFGVSIGDHPIALVPVVVSLAVCCGAIGVFFGSVCTHEQQVTGFGMAVTMIASALGGCWWPIEVMPDAMKTVAKFFPTYWGVQGLHDVMSFGKSWDAVMLECAILWLFALSFLGIALFFLKRKTA
ncbi:MAG: ABC transporter permease [Candidatus Hinthialibacter antarcticus]|nr:ABC transporter permease [Candidatus Hinthialibacter antarcticus]